jgi:hypothetical protein
MPWTKTIDKDEAEEETGAHQPGKMLTIFSLVSVSCHNGEFGYTARSCAC